MWTSLSRIVRLMGSTVPAEDAERQDGCARWGAAGRGRDRARRGWPVHGGGAALRNGSNVRQASVAPRPPEWWLERP